MIYPEGGEPICWNEAGNAALVAGHALGEPVVLFTKFEDEEIEPEIEKLRGAGENGNETSDEKDEGEKMVSIDDFTNLDLRVAKVISAERVEGTDKLLKVQISLGDEERQIVAGIGGVYEPESLIGKKIVVLKNLKPAVIRGVESDGMLLAAGDGETHSILTVDSDIPEGTKIS